MMLYRYTAINIIRIIENGKNYSILFEMKKNTICTALIGIILKVNKSFLLS